MDVWHIYLQNWVVLGVNVGRYTIHGVFGTVTRLDIQAFWHIFRIQLYRKKKSFGARMPRDSDKHNQHLLLMRNYNYSIP